MNKSQLTFSFFKTIFYSTSWISEKQWFEWSCDLHHIPSINIARSSKHFHASKNIREKKVTRKTNICFRGYNTVSLERLMTKEKHRLVRIGLWSMKWSKHLQFKFFSINFQVNENALLHRATKFWDKLWGLFFLFTFRTFVIMYRCVYINEVMEFIFFISSVRAKNNRKKRRSFQTWLHCSKERGKLGICRIENRAIYNHSRLILVC